MKFPLKIIAIVLLVIIIIGTIFVTIVGGMAASVIEASPDIDPTTMLTSMSQTSNIYDSDGNLLERVESTEYRTIVTMEEIPDHLSQAFVAIEDERFYSHPGVDIIGIAASVAEQALGGGELRGASTITQQLVRNVYLSNERSLARKITEAYLALVVESQLSKDEIMEAYLNKIYLGQGAYGVQEAALTYFDKDVSDLTIAESALFAGVVKGSTAYQPFTRVSPQEYDVETMELVGQTNILGEDMYLVFNPRSVQRQALVLNKMLELGFISQDQYNEANSVDIATTLSPGQRSFNTMTSYPVDFVQEQTVQILADHYDISNLEAQEMLIYGGLEIYSTIDVDLQEELEDIYDNFVDLVMGYGNPYLISWSRDSNGNVLDSNGNIIFYRRDNLIDENWNIIFPSNNYEVHDNGDLTIKSIALSAHGDNIRIADIYTINSDNNLVTHSLGSIIVPSSQYTIEDGWLRISSEFLNDQPHIFNINEETGALLISSDSFSPDKNGIVQPQSATVVMDQEKGHVKALVGGRDVEGNKILNRASQAQRQPGSAIKPISVYYPALAEGFTAGSIADDVPISVNGNRWPRNAYSGYRGLQTFRMNLDISSNAGTVDALNQLGIDKSLEYLEKLGIIDPDNPENDSIITSKENSRVNDENPSALALGGMTNGLTPLELTGAFAAIANDGTYQEPMVVEKILDAQGNVIVENPGKTNEVTDKATAYIMKDMLTTVVQNGYTARNAKIPGMATAGKTGTTQDEADIWFVGFTPYYTIATWIGADNPQLTLNRGSQVASDFWKTIAVRLHDGLEPISEFERPDNIVERYISFKSGKLGTNSVSGHGHGTNEIFVEGTEPDQYDDSYKSYRVCTASGRLPSRYCPSSSIGYRSSFVRPVEYDPKDHGGYIPPDMGYGSGGPSSYCNVHTREAYNTFQEYLRGPYSGGSSSSSGDTSSDDNDSDDND